MRKIFTVLGIVAVSAIANAQQTIVLSEDFATYTDGGNTRGLVLQVELISIIQGQLLIQLLLLPIFLRVLKFILQVEWLS